MIFRYYWFRFIERKCSKYGIIKITDTKVGLKNINMGKVAQLYNPHPIEQVMLQPEELFLGPDFLRDEYTLLNCSVVDSPHFSFMKAMQSGDDLEKTDYVCRSSKGILDWRRAVPIGEHLKFWKSMYIKKIEDIENDTLTDVLVYKLNRHYYIYDGKHKAALCAVVGKPIKCTVISEACVFSFYNRYMLEMTNKRSGYTKHNDFLKAYLNQNN